LAVLAAQQLTLLHCLSGQQRPERLEQATAALASHLYSGKWLLWQVFEV